MYEKIKTFKDLIVWQQSFQLTVRIFGVTKNFPREEIYSLVDQLKRAAISISSNIAEGFSRQSYKEKVQFYYQALGSLTEVQNQLLIAFHVGYINKEIFEELDNLTLSIHKLLNLLILKSKTYIRTLPLIH